MSYPIEDLIINFGEIKSNIKTEKAFRDLSDKLRVDTQEEKEMFANGYADWPYLKKVNYHETQIRGYREESDGLTGKALSLNSRSVKIHQDQLTKLHEDYKKKK